MSSTKGHMVHISPGNTKTGNIPSFSLPAKKTCPGSTPLCRKHCYAKNNAERYDRTAACYKRNHAAVKLDNFAENMIHHIHSLNTRFFRIHVSGDFYSQEYLDQWKIMSAAFPYIQFLAFTKSFDLDYTSAPDNLNIIWSVFPDTDFDKIPAGPRAYTDFSETFVDAEYPEGMTDNAVKCDGLCTTCGTCFYSNENQLDTIFDAHGGQLSKRKDK